MIQTKISFLLGIIIFLSIFFVAFNNYQSNETTLLQKIERLEVQNEAFSKQVEAEKHEHHQRLIAERDLYERTKKELNQREREIKEIHNKENLDASLRFNSLQQQYKILRTQHDDLEHHCEKAKKDLATENDGLKSQLNKVQQQLSKSKESRSSPAEHQELLQLKYKTYQLEQENKELLRKLNIFDKGQKTPFDPKPTIEKSFKEQIPVESQNVLQQPFPEISKSSTTAKENLVTPSRAHLILAKTSTRLKPLPKGFLPIPELKNEIGENSKHSLNEIKALDDTLGKPQNLEIDENENGAHEVLNDNDFNIEEKNPQNNLAGIDNFDPEKNMVNNAAEELDKPFDKKSLRNDGKDLEIIHSQNGIVKEKLTDEIAGDHGKEPDGYPEMDLHMIEGQPEEDNDLGDIGEYDDPRKSEGVAERN